MQINIIGRKQAEKLLQQKQAYKLGRIRCPDTGILYHILDLGHMRLHYLASLPDGSF